MSSADAIEPTALPPVEPLASDGVNEPAVAPIDTSAEVAPVEQPAGETDWTLWAAIAAALGLAGAGIVLASRRRRTTGTVQSEVVTANTRPAAKPEPVARPMAAAAPIVAAPMADPIFAQREVARHEATSDPLFARKPDVTTPVTDPLFTRPREAAQPVTDPLFMTKVEHPPVTDPLFKDHPDYVGPGSRRNWGINQPTEPQAKPARELEYAE